MARKLKIVCVCTAGMGSGFLFAMTVEQVAKKLGYRVSVEVVGSASVAGMEADLYVTTAMLAKGLAVPADKPMVTVVSFTNKDEMEEKLGPVLRSLAEAQ